MVNSAADWGISDPLALPKTAALMKMRGISNETIRMVTYQNAIDAFGKSGQIDISDFEDGLSVEKTEKFHGNSILRGGQQPDVSKDSLVIQ